MGKEHVEEDAGQSDKGKGKGVQKEKGAGKGDQEEDFGEQDDKGAGGELEVNIPVHEEEGEQEEEIGCKSDGEAELLAPIHPRKQVSWFRGFWS